MSNWMSGRAPRKPKFASDEALNENEEKENNPANAAGNVAVEVEGEKGNQSVASHVQLEAGNTAAEAPTFVEQDIKNMDIELVEQQGGKCEVEETGVDDGVNQESNTEEDLEMASKDMGVEELEKQDGEVPIVEKEVEQATAITEAAEESTPSKELGNTVAESVNDNESAKKKERAVDDKKIKKPNGVKSVPEAMLPSLVRLVEGSNSGIDKLTAQFMTENEGKDDIPSKEQVKRKIREIATKNNNHWIVNEDELQKYNIPRVSTAANELADSSKTQDKDVKVSEEDAQRISLLEER
jgi:hypothetical protein